MTWGKDIKATDLSSCSDCGMAIGEVPAPKTFYPCCGDDWCSTCYPNHYKKTERHYQILNYPQTWKAVEERSIRANLRWANGNVSRAAEILDMGLRTMERKITEYGLRQWLREIRKGE